MLRATERLGARPPRRRGARGRGAGLLVGAWLVSGCGGSGPAAAPPPPPPEEARASAAPQAGPEAPSVEQEVGALNVDATTKTFFALLPKLERCQEEGRTRDERLAFLAGDVELEVHVRRDGKAGRAFLSRSTLGDRGAERCIVAAARAASWPRPEGGGDAVAKNAFQLPSHADRDAVAWQSSNVAPAVAASGRAFRACRRGKRLRFELTAYVDVDGSVIAAGASSPDGEAEAVAECMVKATKALKLPSPGDRPAKVTFAAP